MLVLSTASFLIGAALGQRFNVFVLIPAVAVVLALAVGTGISNATTAWSIVGIAAVAATSIQIGYLIGITIREVPAAEPRPSRSTTARHPAR